MISAVQARLISTNPTQNLLQKCEKKILAAATEHRTSVRLEVLDTAEIVEKAKSALEFNGFVVKITKPIFSKDFEITISW